MSDGGINPNTRLEKALMEHDRAQVVRFVAEGGRLSGTAPARWLATPAFPEEVAQLVLKLALPREMLESINTTRWYHYHGDALRETVRRALAPLPNRPNTAEKRLIDAVVRADSAEVLKLVREKPGTLRNFAPELLIMLPELTRHAVLALLTAGFVPAAVPMLFRFLVKEAEEPEVLADQPYRKRLMYANLLIHHLQGEAVSPDEEWYPMGNTVEDGCDRGVWCRTYSYCFDPRHLYRPRSADEEYEKPTRRLR